MCIKSFSISSKDWKSLFKIPSMIGAIDVSSLIFQPWFLNLFLQSSVLMGTGKSIRTIEAIEAIASGSRLLGTSSSKNVL